jgi:hypothetical protein
MAKWGKLKLPRIADVSGCRHSLDGILPPLLLAFVEACEVFPARINSTCGL